MKSLWIGSAVIALGMSATSSQARPPLTLAIAFCSGSAIQDQAMSAEPTADAAAVPRDAAGFVAKAGASDLYEIQSSRLAQSQASSDGVKRFARMMIEHHTRTTQQVTAAAKAAGLNPPPPALEPPQQAMLDELQGLSGAQFDAAYLRQQRVAHDQALALHSGYAEQGDTPALRTAAKSAVPIIRRHIEQLRTLSAQ